MNLLPSLIFSLSNLSKQTVVIMSHFTHAGWPSKGPTIGTCRSDMLCGSVVLIGTISNRYHHKMRIWKFIPNEHEVDLSWQDDAFGKNKVRKKTV